MATHTHLLGCAVVVPRQNRAGEGNRRLGCNGHQDNNRTGPHSSASERTFPQAAGEGQRARQARPSGVGHSLAPTSTHLQAIRLGQAVRCWREKKLFAQRKRQPREHRRKIPQQNQQYAPLVRLTRVPRPLDCKAFDDPVTRQLAVKAGPSLLSLSKTFHSVHNHRPTCRVV